MGSAEISGPPINKIELRSPEGLKAVINPSGAYVEQLQGPEGRDLLFPRQDVNGKDRGGNFACAPVFGPGEAVGLRQHGFARNLQWESVDQSDLSATFKLDNPNLQDESLEAYKDCTMQMHVRLGHNETSLLTELIISNNGESDFAISPAFHPYFPMLAKSVEEVDIKLSDKDIVNYTADELAGTQVLDSDLSSPIQVINGSGKVEIAVRGFQVPVAWTDKPDQYFCVEPTMAGAVTGEKGVDLSQYSLNPGATAEFAMKITWKTV